MNKEKPKISVIIPVYNVEKYLRKCLDSVINQTLKNIEIILIDDGSTDNSLKICNEYKVKDNRITVLHQKNAGVSVARNRGLDIAKGEYIGFVDSDDWLSLDFYEKLYEKAKLENYEVTVARTIDFFGKYNQYKELPERNEITINFKDVVWDSLYKKSFLNQYKISFPEIKIFEDVLFSFMINCFVTKRFLNVNSFYYRRRDRKNSTMYNYRKNFNPKSRLEIIDLCEEFLNSIKNTKYYEKAEKIFYQRKINYLFEILEYDKSFFKYIKNEIKNINFSENEYILPYLKEKCKRLLNSRNYIKFKQSEGFLLFYKNKIIYLIYLILLKLGIKDNVKKILQKLGYKFQE